MTKCLALLLALVMIIGGMPITGLPASVFADDGSPLADGTYDVYADWRQSNVAPSPSAAWQQHIQSTRLVVSGDGEYMTVFLSTQTVSGAYIETISDAANIAGNYATVEAYDEDDVTPVLFAFTVPYTEEPFRTRPKKNGTTMGSMFLHIDFASATLSQEQITLTVKKATLQATLSEAQAIQTAGKGDWSDTTWTVLESAIGAAVEVNSNDNATQMDVNIKDSALKSAISGLVAVVKKGELQTALSQAQAVNQGTYSGASWNDLQSAISAAVLVNNNANATQADVDVRTLVLNYAMSWLTEDSAGIPVEGTYYSMPIQTFLSNASSNTYDNPQAAGNNKRIMFNDRALVKAKPDGGYQVTLQYYSQSLYDCIQIVNPAKVAEVKALTAYLGGLGTAIFCYPAELLAKAGSWDKTGESIQ
jgi:hypothetical protein